MNQSIGWSLLAGKVLVAALLACCSTAEGYKSLNDNLRLILLSWVSKQNSDPKILIIYHGRVILLTFTYCVNGFCSLNSLSLKTDVELPILVMLEAAY